MGELRARGKAGGKVSRSGVQTPSAVGCKEHPGPRGQRRGGQQQGRRIIGVPSERLGGKQHIRLEVAAVRFGASDRTPGGHGDAYLSAQEPSGRLPAAVAAHRGVEAPRGQEAGCIMPGTAPHWPPARVATGPAPDWLGISSWRLIGYCLPPPRSGLCHTHGRTWIWVLAPS